jgi:uncharacterized protein (TIGR00730 family)
MSDHLSAQEREPVAMHRIEVGVLGSARLTEPDGRWTQAYTLGGLLADAGYAVVSGGYGGLMAAVSRGAHERGGYVIGLSMLHWTGIEPNRWNADLRWSSTYGERLNHILRCDAVIALPGGVGTLSEMAVAWSASQTEGRALPIILLGDCWPPLVASFREHLIISDQDLNLLRFADSPEEAVQVVRHALQQPGQIGPGPHG